MDAPGMLVRLDNEVGQLGERAVFSEKRVSVLEAEVKVLKAQMSLLCASDSPVKLALEALDND